jgi:hypothetical protein
MGMAVCFKCGSTKSGALVACRNCRVAPKTNSEYAVSLALSDHLSTKFQLTQYSYELRNAKKLSVPREALTQAFDALKDPQLLAMLGAQSSVSEAAPQPSPIPRAASQQPQAQSVSSSAPSASVAMKWSEDIEARKELADVVRRSYVRIWDSCVTGYIKSEWRDFDADVLAKATRRFVYEFSADGVDELVSGEAATEILEQQIEVFRHLYTKTAFSEVSAEVRMITAFLEMVALRPEIQQPNSMPRFVQNKQVSAQPPAASIPPSSKPARRFAVTTLNKSPFAVLGVTTRDDRRRIVELAEEKSLELDHELCQKARSDLTNPRTRLSAEIAWLPGVSPRKATQLVDRLLHDPLTIRQESGLPTLAHLNLMASAFETVKDSHESDDLAEFIQEVANLAEELYPEEVLRDINEDRSVSGFPEVKTVEQIEEQLSERKRYCRNAIKEALDRLPSAKLVQVMTDTVDGATLGGEDHAPGLIDDLVDSYEVETQAPLQSGAENIHKLIQSAKDAAPTGEAAVKPYVDKIEAATRSWDRIAQPIQLSAKARGTEHDLSSSLGWAIRGLALDLFNKHDILPQTQRLTALLQELFSEIPEISERVEQDADALDDIAKEREDAAIIEPIKKLSEGVIKTAEKNSGNAFNEGVRLLEEGSQLLKSLAVSSTSNAYKQANNILAHGGNRCAIEFGNATSKWAPCIILLERALSLASDADLQNRISENLTVVKNNQASLGDLEPISSAPSLHTINGCGFTMYGSSDHRPDGSYMTTYYFVILAIPLFPIARYRVMHTGGNSYKFLGKGHLRTFDKWHIAITLGAIGLMILL